MNRQEFIDRYDRLRNELVMLKKIPNYLLFLFNPDEWFYSCVIIRKYLGEDAVEYYNEIMGTNDKLIRDYCWCYVADFNTLDRIIALEMFYQHCLSHKSYKNFK